MTKKPLLWVLLAALAVASAGFSWRYFTRAFPLLSVDIRMDWEEALARARELASEQQLGPPDYRDAASFSLESEVQTFVELEGGGKPAFAELVGDNLFTPYRWKVRHFKERERREATFSFAPDGTPNGFVERLSEDAPGPALPEPAARGIAESAGRRAWRVDLAPFQPVEHSQELRIGGRLDHTFVYERPDRRLGEGRLRLRLTVSGDKLTEVTYFIKVPDAFSRRYDQMRSANTAIGVGGALAFLVVYGVGGIAIGLFFLMRERRVIWRQPVFWGASVGLAQTAVTINEWPLAWMQYDTALSTQSFVAQQVSQALIQLVANTGPFSLSFMAAESLTRRAFPDHPQFWRLWSRDVAGSRAVLGRTVGGYLFVPVFVAYDVALYLFATKRFGWWTPSEALFNPDVLAAYAPWFSAIAKSFQAGFWEESLFRAVPIAGAALIGDWLGNRRLWIVGAFIVQAVIFGAGHAPYPTQPAYARPVELVLPSIGFGLLYLVFGLLPGIVAHFAFDVFWFAMPLFASSAAGIRLQQVLVVGAIFVPLWVVFARRVAARKWTDLAPEHFNAAWQPPPLVDKEPPIPTKAVGTARATPPLSPPRIRAITVAGAIAAIAWIVSTAILPVQRQPLRATRTEAAAAARGAFAPSGPGPGWQFLPVADEDGGMDHRLVWKTAGRSTYESLLGSYLTAPGWTVFVRTFQGDVAERAEAWTVHLDRDGVVQRISHDLPESRRGQTLDGTAATDLAERTLAGKFHIDPASLRRVSATPTKLPERTDWLMTFADPSHKLPQGEPRLSVRIAGSEVADVRRFVYVPEDWQRRERNNQTVASVIQVVGVVVAALLILGGVIAAIVSWSRRQFALRLFLAVFAVFFLLSGVRLANGFPAVMASLSTSQPLGLQLAVLVGLGVVSLGLLSAAMALVAGAAPMWSAASERLDTRTAIRIGVALGVLAAAARALSALIGSTGPAWPSDAGAGSFSPLVAASINPVVTLLTRFVVVILMVIAANQVTAGWTRRRVLGALLLWMVGGILGVAGPAEGLLPWAASATLVGVLLLAAYVGVLRHDLSLVPIAVAVMTTAGTLHEGWSRAFPGALPGAIIAVVVMWAVAYWWFEALRESRSSQAAGAATT